MSICPECGERVKKKNRMKIGKNWHHKFCDEEKRKIFQKKKRERFLEKLKSKEPKKEENDEKK